eukprot:gene10778-biopygen2269
MDTQGSAVRWGLVVGKGFEGDIGSAVGIGPEEDSEMSAGFVAVKDTNEAVDKVRFVMARKGWVGCKVVGHLGVVHAEVAVDHKVLGEGKDL